MELEILTLVAILVVIASLGYYFWSASQGYYDNYGRKIPLDEIKSKNEQHDSEIASLKAQLEAQTKKLETNSNDTQYQILQKLNELEKRLETLERGKS